MSEDSWRPSASTERLRLRARLRDRIRAYFRSRDVLEVDTPILSAAGPTDLHVHSLVTRVAGSPGARYLLGSPEFPMKRLLAAGHGDCWQLARVFRDGERGRLHVPEFDLLEWYRTGFDHHDLMRDVEALVHALAADEAHVPETVHSSYSEAFVRCLGTDPLSATTEELTTIAREYGVEGAAGLEDDDRDGWLDLLLTTRVLPECGRDKLLFLHAWPASQAALARLEPDDPRVARRFEVYWDGIELANGYHELAEADEQRKRFEADNACREARGLETIPIDERLLAALAEGLPDCAGVALGFDRLCLCIAGLDDLDDVLAFPPERA